jgi:hypothetical protein
LTSKNDDAMHIERDTHIMAAMHLPERIGLNDRSWIGDQLEEEQELANNVTNAMINNNTV